MKILGPTRHTRLNEVAALLYLLLSGGFLLCLLSYDPLDPSWNTATGLLRPNNLIGFAGSYTADALFQTFGLAAFALPLYLLVVSWKWFRSQVIEAPMARLCGALALLVGLSTALSLGPGLPAFGGSVAAGGVLGAILASMLVGSLNTAGAVLLTAMWLIVCLYLVSTFALADAARWAQSPVTAFRRMLAWQEERREQREEARQEALARRREHEEEAQREREAALHAIVVHEPGGRGRPPIARPVYQTAVVEREPESAPEAWEHASAFAPAEVEAVEHIPIHALEEADAPLAVAFPAQEVFAAEEAIEEIPVVERAVEIVDVPEGDDTPPWEIEEVAVRQIEITPRRRVESFVLPPTSMMNEPPPRSGYDAQELQETATRIKTKFAEFNVLGNVVQINPGPVVTTYEFKPEAGIKYSRITTLTEDLCLGLQAESILVERIPGKPTVGIEVPNSRSEIISLRQILESDEFRNSPSPLTIALGKDIDGRIKVATLETMPHLLIAGSTGAGKSVMLNSMIMSVLCKATPHDVRLVMVDPKRVELGIYEGIPHLLTPVITDPKKATNALRNAVLEMERRLKLLALHGVRNIDQFNKKVRAMEPEARATADGGQELRPLPYILIIIDELADLMMLERAGVEESVTRLAQMARAAGMHVVLATQRPSVDVITGLIKANFPARISFRVATRVDSRTILDCMGAESLLGRGDMLFLPPGSSRLIRHHGAYVSESEINRVVEFWKDQARPEYDQSFLVAPLSAEGEAEEEFEGEQDPQYEAALRIVQEMGKASTSTLQRRLRLGYGRAARILDMMQRDGIIGPPDGSKPREVLKSPGWLDETREDHR